MLASEGMGLQGWDVARLKRYFGFKRDLVLRAEQVFYHALVREAPRLTSLRRVLDETVLAKLLGKRKRLTDPRPDYFHLNDRTNMALLGEYDESEDHEDDDDRLRTIAHHAGCGISRTYVFRVRGRHGQPDAVCERVSRRGHVWYRLTARGRSVVEAVGGYVNWCLDQMELSVMPGPGEAKVYF